MSVSKIVFGATFAIYPVLRLVGDVPVVKAGVATVCIVSGLLLAGDGVIEYVLKRQRERWRR